MINEEGHTVMGGGALAVAGCLVIVVTAKIEQNPYAKKVAGSLREVRALVPIMTG
jgi:hypothetical protein